MAVVRELIVQWLFKVKDGELSKLENKLQSLKKEAIAAGEVIQEALSGVRNSAMKANLGLSQSVGLVRELGSSASATKSELRGIGAALNSVTSRTRAAARAQKSTGMYMDEFGMMRPIKPEPPPTSATRLTAKRGVGMAPGYYVDEFGMIRKPQTVRTTAPMLQDIPQKRYGQPSYAGRGEFAGRRQGGFFSQLDQGFDKMDAEMFRIFIRTQSVQQIAGMARMAIAPIVAPIVSSIRSFADLEQTRIGFGTLVGGDQLGRQRLEELDRMAVEGAFSVDEARQGALQLLATGTQEGSVVDVMSQIQDVAAASGADLTRLVKAYSDVQNKGKLYAEELTRQFGENRVNLRAMLKESLGVSDEVLQEMIKNSEVTAEMVAEAFRNATAEGGRFYKASERRTKTLAGQWNKITDVIQILRERMGEVFSESGIKKLVTTLADALNGSSKELISLAKGFASALRPAIEFASGALSNFVEVLKVFIGQGEDAERKGKALGIALGVIATAAVLVAGSGIVATIISLTKAFGGLLAILSPFLIPFMKVVMVLGLLYIIVEDIVFFFMGWESALGWINEGLKTMNAELEKFVSKYWNKLKGFFGGEGVNTQDMYAAMVGAGNPQTNAGAVVSRMFMPPTSGFGMAPPMVVNYQPVVEMGGVAVNGTNMTAGQAANAVRDGAESALDSELRRVQTNAPMFGGF